MASTGFAVAEGEGPRWMQRGPAVGPAIVLAHPVFPGIVYAQVVELLYRSNDAGITWELMTGDLPPNAVVVVSPESSELIYAFIKNSNRILKSIDAGRNWVEVNSGLKSDVRLSTLVISPARPTVLYAGATFPCSLGGCTGDGGVFKSTTGGTRWEHSGLSGHWVYGLAVSSSDPDVIYGFGPTEFFRSSDGARHWNVSALPGQAFVCSTCSACPGKCLISVDPVLPSTVFLGEWGGIQGLFKSTSAGQEWSQLSTGLPKAPDTIRGEVDVPPEAMVAAPSDSATIYAGFAMYSDIPQAPSLDGVFQSQDGGSEWNGLNSGLTNRHVHALAIDASGRVLYAGTDAGVFQLDFTQRPAIDPVGRSGRPRVVPPRN